MRSFARLGVLALFVLALPGCMGLSGTWKFNDIVPADAAKDFRMASITFERNGNFSADAEYAGKTEQMKGTYSFDKDAERLTFATTDGHSRVYGAALCKSCSGRLSIWNADGPKKWIATMVRK